MKLGNLFEKADSLSKAATTPRWGYEKVEDNLYEILREGHIEDCVAIVYTGKDAEFIAWARDLVPDLAYRLRIAVEGLSVHQCPNVSSANWVPCYPCDALKEIEEPEKK